MVVGEGEGGGDGRNVRAYSITAACMPRHIPKKGTLDSRAYLIAAIYIYICMWGEGVYVCIARYNVFYELCMCM